MNEELSTNRTDVAAFLLARGLTFLRTEGETDAGAARFVRFVFADSDGKGAELVREYYGRGTVCASDYVDATRRIKDILWDVKRRVGRGNGEGNHQWQNEQKARR